MFNMEHKGRVVLVTGASRGIGRAVAQGFAQKGARVAIHYKKNKSAAEETLASLDGEGHLCVQADMAHSDDSQKMVEEIVQQMGQIDVLVNNAGIYEEHPLYETDFDAWREAWERTIHANLMGPAHLAYLVARRMKEKGGGRIINISSRGAFKGEPEAPAYGASKAGLNALTQSLAVALAPHGIYVYGVAPGWILTDMTSEILDTPRGDDVRNQIPFGRVGTPEEVAHTVLFLASEGAEYLTGTIVDVNGASYLRT